MHQLTCDRLSAGGILDRVLPQARARYHPRAHRESSPIHAGSHRGRARPIPTRSRALFLGQAIIDEANLGNAIAEM
jgi:hypothetical protein